MQQTPTSPSSSTNTPTPSCAPSSTPSCAPESTPSSAPSSMPSCAPESASSSASSPTQTSWLKRNCANIVTCLRIPLSLLLLVAPAFSLECLIVYTLCGITDMIDGPIARHFHAESARGSRLDSCADIVFVLCSLAFILPNIPFPTWLMGWVVGIAVIKLFNAAASLLRLKRIALPHTKLNKATGAVLFACVYLMPFAPQAIYGIPACLLATVAALHETALVFRAKPTADSEQIGR